MTTRTTQLLRLALVCLALGLAAITAPRTARAEVDTFGIGDGHRGAYVAAAAGEIVNAYAPVTADAAKGAAQVAIGASIGDPAGFVASDLVLIALNCQNDDGTVEQPER